MIAKPVIDLWVQLNVTPSYSRPLVPERPLVSNDNPFSESLFKTVQYHPTFPGRLADPAQATRWMRAMERWYNWHHAHTGLGLMTPAAGHFGFAETLPDVSTYPVFSWTGPCVAPQIKGSCLLLFIAVVRGMRFQNGSRQGELDCRLHSPMMLLAKSTSTPTGRTQR